MSKVSPMKRNKTTRTRSERSEELQSSGSNTRVKKQQRSEERAAKLFNVTVECRRLTQNIIDC
jgi:hypothetical protein